MSTVLQKIIKPANYVSARMLVSLPVTATANTDFIVTLPAAAICVNATVFTTTAYGAATDAQISIGSTPGGVDYVAAVTIKAIGVVPITRVNTAAAVFLAPGALALNVRVVQTGAASATGAATLEITFGMPV